MAQRELEQRVENLERRVETVEQILPTLATEADLADVKAEMKADLDAAVAPLATKAEVEAQIKAEGEVTRRHFNVVAEGLRADIRMSPTRLTRSRREPMSDTPTSRVLSRPPPITTREPAASQCEASLPISSPRTPSLRDAVSSVDRTSEMPSSLNPPRILFFES